MSGITHDSEPTENGEQRTSERGGTASEPTTVRVVDRRPDSDTADQEEPPPRIEVVQRHDWTVNFGNTWQLVAAGILAGAFATLLIVHLLGGV